MSDPPSLFTDNEFDEPTADRASASLDPTGDLRPAIRP